MGSLFKKHLIEQLSHGSGNRNLNGNVKLVSLLNYTCVVIDALDEGLKAAVMLLQYLIYIQYIILLFN